MQFIDFIFWKEKDTKRSKKNIASIFQIDILMISFNL